MTVLGINTAADPCGAALASGGMVIASAFSHAPRAHAERLLGMIDECLRSAGPGTRPDAVAVASGPGSFTGLRIGYSTAKGLCLAWGCPLVAVPTFDAWADAALRGGALESVGARGGRFIVAMASGREDAYAAVFRRLGAAASAEIPPAIHPLVELAGIAAAYPGAPVLCDRPDFASGWFGADAVLLSPAGAGEVAGAVALLGAASRASGAAADLRASEPAYLKDFSTTRKR